MRVVELSTFHEQCGIATYSEALVAALRAEGARVDVLAPRLALGSPARGEQPLRVWDKRRASLRQAFRAFREIRRRDADVVHLQVSLGLVSSRFVLALSRACRCAGIPLVATLHERRGGGFVRDLRLARMLLALEGAALVVHNHAHAAELERRTAHVIPHGIPEPAPRELAEAKRALGLDPTTAVVAHFGFIHPDKGIDAVLHAVAELRQRRGMELHYLVCGGTFPSATSRRYLERLRRTASELGIGPHVTIRGEFLDEASLSRQLGAADLVLLNYRTGRAQATSGAVRHAFTAGRPIAVSRAPVFDDVRDAVLTLDAPLVDAIPRLVADRRLQAELTERARLRARVEGWSRVAARHLGLFEALTRRA